jgi:hypothetical protein
MRRNFIGVMCFLSNFLFAQMPESLFVAEDRINDYDIYFSNDGRYSLSVWNYSMADIDIGYDLSFGKYTISENEIILIDEIHHYQMLFTYETLDTLHVKSGLYFMMGKSFIRYLYPHEDFRNSYTSLSYNIDTSQIIKKRNEYVTQNKKPFLLELGNYYSDSFLLSILSENRYILKLIMGDERLVISNGSWKRERNKLILYDINLNHSFYLLIEERKLFSNLLPGDYKGEIFYFRQYWNY